jgi:integrase
MNGSLRQRSAGSWELRVYIGTDPVTGHRLDRTATVRGTRADAESELAAMVASVQAVRAVGVRSRVGELLEACLPSPPPAGRRRQSAKPARCSTAISTFTLGHIPVGDVTAAMIDATYAVLSRRGGVGGRPLAPGTLARVHVVLRAAFAQAVRWGRVWDNPVERAHRVVTVSRELRPPTPQELRALLEHVAARDRQFHTLLVLAAFTGARRAQLLGLRWHNVHLATKRVSFSARLGRRTRRPRVDGDEDETGSRRRPRPRNGLGACRPGGRPRLRRPARGVRLQRRQWRHRVEIESGHQGHPAPSTRCGAKTVPAT